jgi:prepilin-type N-terminal cleavage/methylation domain-containing protein
MNKKAGFTLIEVLTVIMIIAILASIVLVSLEAARNKTKDVTIQNQIGQLRSLAETFYTFEAGYEDFTSTSQYDLIRGKIKEMNGIDYGEEGALTVIFSADNNNYCAYAELVRNEGEVFCVDSSGDAYTSESVACDVDNVFCRGSASCAEVGEYCAVNGDCCSNSCDGMNNVCVDVDS